jgi:hypothetical protein
MDQRVHTAKDNVRIVAVSSLDQRLKATVIRPLIVVKKDQVLTVQRCL